jgi:myo-inositol-1(or 4)-monophosphatase
MNSRLETAQRAARAAGQVLYEKFNLTREVRAKGRRDIVTDADFAAERAVRQVLLADSQEDRLLSEEDDTATRKALWAQARVSPTLALWVVDPLDGTTNYAHHLPHFSVSVALYLGGQVELGVVYDPMREELFSAERRRGATLNGEPIAPSSVSVFEQALIGTEWSRAPAERKSTAVLLSRMVRRAMSARAIGSAALSFCYVAAGRLDGYFHLSLSPWDVAAGALIADEAGCRVTTPSGAPWTVHSKAYLVTNGHLHATMMRYLRPSS